MVFGVLKQRGQVLPKAPEGCGWHFALIFKEMAEQAQTGNLRVAAVAQLQNVVKSQRRDHPEFLQLSYGNIHPPCKLKIAQLQYNATYLQFSC
ncbi:hypothetical protein NC651_021464 [Populus alba x Populus x berolinensis]|nr:hypothetical protein NC651_021464 [Populus alba x Populus x berolinensis]